MTLQGWVLFETQMHALFVGDHGPVYLCGEVLYERQVLADPPTEPVTVSCCPTCVAAVDRVEGR